MKKLILILCLLPVMAGANDLRGVLLDSLSAADTVVQAKRIDTVVTAAMDLRGYNTIQFYSRVGVYEVNPDTNWTNDTFFVYFQHSPNKVHWNTVEIDTFLTTDSAFSAMVLKISDSIVGNWGRGMLIHWDSLEAAADIKENAYRKDFQLWIMQKK